MARKNGMGIGNVGAILFLLGAAVSVVSAFLVDVIPMVPLVLGVAGLLVGLLNITSKESLGYAQTIAFSTLVILQLSNSINYHTAGKSFLSKKLFSNKYLFMALLLSIALQLLVVYVLNEIFRTNPLILIDWLFIIGAGFVVIITQEIIKVFAKPDY